MGQLLLGRWREVDRESVIDFLRSWVIKAFFLAFMITLVPPSLTYVTSFSFSDLAPNMVEATIWTIRLIFLIDICLSTIGYIFESRLLDTHIRSTNPLGLGWVSALICYPPFALIGEGRWIDYSDGTEWMTWFEGHELVLAIWGIVLVGLTALYAWATVIFGLRFSNLTHRGIITNGPYRLTKHPAYIAKNIFWWVVHLPFLSTTGLWESLTNSVFLLVVNVVYYLRAKTEEIHLLADPLYRDYVNWIAWRNRQLARALGKKNFQEAFFLIIKGTTK